MIKNYWWNECGYSYYWDGTLWGVNEATSIGQKIKQNDTIEISLDLKDECKISFIVNGKSVEDGFVVKQNVSNR